MIEIVLADEAATGRLGARIGRALAAGDLLLLDGPLGAGKTCLARAILRTIAGARIDVPSPTFNLVIPYQFAAIRVAHMDLYRLSGPDEADEMGIEDALSDGAALVEWPDRLPADLQAQGSWLRFTGLTPRTLTIDGDASFMARFDAA